MNNVLLDNLKKSTLSFNLPSKGKFWQPGSIEKAENLVAYPMTGQDEILLLNTSPMLIGSVLADIIQNCVPDIKDVWSMPRLDLDAILIAIRCVSYGNTMNNNFSCPHCEQRNKYQIDLPNIINGIKIPNYSEPIALDSNNTIIYMKPMSFKENFQNEVDQLNKMAVIEKLQKSDLTEDEKNRIINENLRKITQINLKKLCFNIYSVSVNGSEAVSDQDQIYQWLSAIDRQAFSDVTKAIESKAAEYTLPKIHNVCKNTACNKEFDADIDFNIADFLSQ